MNNLSNSELTEVLYAVYGSIERYDTGELDRVLWNRSSLVSSMGKLLDEGILRDLDVVEDFPDPAIL